MNEEMYFILRFTAKQPVADRKKQNQQKQKQDKNKQSQKYNANDAQYF